MLVSKESLRRLSKSSSSRRIQSGLVTRIAYIILQDPRLRDNMWKQTLSWTWPTNVKGPVGYTALMIAANKRDKDEGKYLDGFWLGIMDRTTDEAMIGTSEGVV